MSKRVAVVSTTKRELWSYKHTIRGRSATMRAAFELKLECGHTDIRSTPCKHVTCKRCP